MKSFIKNYLLRCLPALLLLGTGCKKEELEKVKELAPPKIYITNIVDGRIAVNVDSRIVSIDKAAKKITVALGVNRSGLADREAYSVKLTASDAGLPADVTPLAPTEYAIVAAGKGGSVATLDVPAEEASAAFAVEVPKSVLDAHAGKKIGINLSISDPSKYELNEAMSTAALIIDVASFGERQVEITTRYLKNPGAPFARADQGASSRFGILADWISNDAVKNIDNRTKGGFDSFNGGGYLAMERWGTPEIPNGKIYQTIKLPQGKYRFDADFETAVISNQLLLTVAAGAGLPDIDNISQAIATAPYNAPRMMFELPAEQEVSIGFLGNLVNDAQAFRVRFVKLYKFESPFD